MHFQLGLLCLIIGLNQVLGVNVLYLSPLAVKSHILWNRALINGLAAKGHNVTAVSTDLDENPPKNVHYIHLEEAFAELTRAGKNFDPFDEGDVSVFTGMRSMYSWCNILTNGVAKSKGIQRLLNYPDKFKFDVVVNDFTCGSFLLGFMGKFKYPPLVSVTAFNYPSCAIDIVGGHKQFAYAPFYLLPFGEKLNFAKRAYNMGAHLYDKYLRHSANGHITKLIQQVFPYDLPHVSELERRSALMLVNIHPAIDFPEPLPPNTIAVGGLQIQIEKPISKEQEKFIAAGKNGTIFFSLGSIIHRELLGPEKIRNYLAAFKQIPEYNFLWKLKVENVSEEIPENVMISKTVSQNDALAQPNIKLFFSHGGLLSIHEAAWHGIPMLGLPFNDDQFVNLAKAHRFGFAENIDYKMLYSQNIRDHLLKMLCNQKYKVNAMKVSKNFKDQPQKPLHRAIWWIEYSIRNPHPDHLKAPTIQLGFLKSNGFDIIITITVAIMLIPIGAQYMYFRYYKKRAEEEKTEDEKKTN